MLVLYPFSALKSRKTDLHGQTKAGKEKTAFSVQPIKTKQL
jgi:hypothetical protein